MHSRINFLLILFLTNFLATGASPIAQKKQKEELKSTLKKAGIGALYVVAATAVGYGWYYFLFKEQTPKKITVEEFNTLSGPDQWNYIIETGDWTLLQQCTNEWVVPCFNPLHTIIKAAKDHSQSIVEGIELIVGKYPKAINEQDEQGRTPILVAIHELQNKNAHDICAEQLIKAILFLAKNKADLQVQGPIKNQEQLQGTLFDAIAEIEHAAYRDRVRSGVRYEQVVPPTMAWLEEKVNKVDGKSAQINTASTQPDQLKKAPLTDGEFANLEPLEQWKYVICSGEWDRLSRIKVWRSAIPLHEIITAAENHTNDIVAGLEQIYAKYPSDRDKLDDDNITPLWRAMYKLQQADNDIQADQMARAIVFLMRCGTNTNWHSPLSEGATTIGTLEEAMKRVKADTVEVRNMKELFAQRNNIVFIQPENIITPHLRDQNQLKRTIADENFDGVKELLVKGVRLSENIVHFIIDLDHKLDIVQAMNTIVQAIGKELDFNAPNAQGISPLFMAMHNIQRYSNDDAYVDKMLHVIDILIDNGAQKNMQGPSNYRYTSPTAIKGSLLHAVARIQYEDIRQKVAKHLQVKAIDESIEDTRGRLWKDIV